MRVWLSGPRIAGIRIGASVGPEDFRRRSKSYQRQTYQRQPAAEPITGSFVYVITDGHRVKVGSSIDPNRRIRELQAGNPRPLQFSFVGITPGPGFDIEMKAKDILRSYRANMHGGDEWYDTSPRSRRRR